jgi:hypothetical protein
MGPMIELRGLTRVFGSKWFGSRRAVDDLTCSIEPGGGDRWGTLLYFTLVVAVVFLAAVVIINRPDP